MRYKLLLFCLTCLCSSALGQGVYTGDYRSQQNPYYWKNKKPKPGYWQQDVAYKIEAYIDHKKETIEADQELWYYNNSTDTLPEVYMHLYQNAFIKGAYLEQLNLVNKVRPKYGKYEEAGLGTEVHDLKVDGALPDSVSLDNTILRIDLVEPMLPGDSIKLDLHFVTYWDHGSTRRRMKSFDAYGWPHFDGVHWYPRMCVYDMRKSWDLDQHLNKELYGDFGTYDVCLNFPNNYVVEATGVLQNPQEVLPDSLKEKLKASNFRLKPWDSPPSTVVDFDSTVRKTWHFRSVNTHDFAFTADPSYRYLDTTVDGVTSIGLVQEPHAIAWQNSADYVQKIISTYSEDFGDYAYPKIIAADARDGMEYPMLTLDGGSDPGYRGLLAHEIGHNWFYGMVGNNETYRAMLDEGFTQFLTSWALRKIDGPRGFIPPLPRFFVLRFIEKRRYHPRVEYVKNYFRLYMDWLDGQTVDMNRHSNDYYSALGHENGYAHVYYKPSAMLYNLQYTLGDSLFLKAMQSYVARWKMAHPYVQDFRDAVQDVAKTDLDWFFDQWIETEKKQDYKIKRVRQKDNKAEIVLKRRQEMISPIDLSVINKNGDTSEYYIPINAFHKKTDATILPKWFGNDKLNSKYKVTVPIEGRVHGAIIDKTRRMADMNVLNNSRFRTLMPHEKYQWKLDLALKDIPPESKYLLLWRPLLAQNRKDGLRPGLNLTGSFMNRLNFFKLKTWYKTYIFRNDTVSAQETEFKKRVDYQFWYNTVFPHAPRLKFEIYSAHIEGLDDHYLLLNYRTFSEWVVGLKARRMARFDNDYMQMAGQWGTSSDPLAVNNYLEISLEKVFEMYRGVSNLSITYRNLGLLADLENKSLPYSFTRAEWKWFYNIGKLQIRTRLYGRGGGQVLHKETALFLGGANTEEMMDNKYYRSRSTFGGIAISDAPSKYQMGGGLNLRAYSGYQLYIQTPNGVMNALNGNYGFSGSFELDLDGLISYSPRLLKQLLHVDFYPFFDIGAIGQKYIGRANKFSGMIADGGLGVDFVIKRFFKVDDVHPLTFRFDFPFFMSHPPAGQGMLDWRYIIAVSRTF